MNIFSKIINGEIPSYKITEDLNHLAFLDINPLQKGHVLVIPKESVDYILDLKKDSYNQLWSFANKVAKAMDEVIDCKRIGISVVGLEVPHVHIHLIPINKVSDMSFDKERLIMSDKDFRDICKLIKSAI